MKPERRHRGGRFALAAARTALRAELGWLRGHPLPGASPTAGALPWRVVPHPATRAAAEDQVVDRERLRAATHALTTLPRRFPRALPRVLAGDDDGEGDVDAWVARARDLLGRLSAAVHGRGPLRAATTPPPARAALTPLVEALTWVHALEPARLARALRLVDAHGDALEVLVARSGTGADHALAVQLLDLALDDPRGPGLGTLRLLGREALWTTSLTADPGDLERMAAALDHQRHDLRWRDPARSAPLGPAVLALVRGALTHDAAARDRTLAVLFAVLPPELLQRWERWWRDVGVAAAHVRRLVAGAGPCQRCARSESEALRTLARRRPPAVRPSRLRDAVGNAAALTPTTAARLVEVLAAVDPQVGPAREPARLALAHLVAHEPRHAERALDVLARVVRAVPGALGQDAAQVAGWLLGERSRVERLGPALLDALVDLARDRRLVGLDGTRWSLLFEHLGVHEDGRSAAAFVRAADGLEVPWRLEDALVVLCAGDPGRLATLVRALRSGDEWTFGQGAALAALARRDDLRPLLVDALVAGEGARARRLVVRATLVRGLGGAEAIARVAAPADAPAPATTCTDPARLRRELEALERLAPGASHPRAGWMRRRAASLRARLAGDAPTSPRRARAAERRAARRALVRALDAWSSAVEACGEHGLAAWLGQPLPREWLDDPRRLRVLAAIVDLPARDRAVRDLAARLLRARLGPAPWDLRDAPANAAFLARLRARGVDGAPWLDSTVRHTWTAQGRELALALEDDPLEVLRMGEPFLTCLAPGESNFFAAIVDAADVNKRVVYARAGQAIVGRCLLALTAEGAIVTYHPYCHDARLGFAERVRAFVLDLAAAMGTRVVGDGEVPRLLASDWYCDPPEDVTGARTTLEAELSAALRVATPEDLPGLLEATFGPAGLDGAALERVVDRPELDERPELALALAPLARSLRPPARVRLVERLVAARAPDAARAVARSIVRAGRVDALDAARLATALLTLGRAHLAHDVLRRTAPRGREHAEERHEAWGRVCEALHREAAAREHYARGAEGRVSTPARDRCRARLAALVG